MVKTYFVGKTNFSTVWIIMTGITFLCFQACEKEDNTPAICYNCPHGHDYDLTEMQDYFLAGNLKGLDDAHFRDGQGDIARFLNPRGIAVDTFGNVYVSDISTIRKINTDGIVTTLAGRSVMNDVEYADGWTAAFNNTVDVGVDGQGNVYVADFNNHLIRKISPVGFVTTLAGKLSYQCDYADGQGTDAKFCSPYGIAVSVDGNVFVADGNLIRKITSDGNVTTYAGAAIDEQGGDTQFGHIADLAVDMQGNVYAADNGNYNIRKITPDRMVTTVAGGTYGYVDGQGDAASFLFFKGIAVDANGNIYVTDEDKIRKITPEGKVTTLFGSTGSYKFIGPYGLAVDALGNVYVSDNLIPKYDLFSYTAEPGIGIIYNIGPQ